MYTSHVQQGIHYGEHTYVSPSECGIREHVITPISKIVVHVHCKSHHNSKMNTG